MARLTPLLTLVLASLAFAACGEKGEPQLSGPAIPIPGEPVPEQPGPPAGDGRGGVALEKVGEFDQPVFVAQPPGETRELYIVEQTGGIVRVDARGQTHPFLDISSQIVCCGEQGLLSMAFAPNYDETGRFYVDYTNRDGDTRVVEYRTKLVKRGRGKKAREVVEVAGRPRVLLKVAQPFANHNGGLVAFGPDGKLYVGLGDGGSGGDPQRNGQDLGTLLGKILRIDPRPSHGQPYTIPADNPFLDRAGARQEIAVYGLRNPWRFSFDRRTDGLWIGDVGQSAQEEIDFVPDARAGANLGWSAYEGTERFNADQEAPNALAPVLTYGRDRGCSVTGGYVVRDRTLPTLYGRYLYADYCEGQLRSFDAAGAVPGPVADDRALGLQVPSISSFGEDSRGRVYALALDGPVYRLVADAG